MKLFKATIIGHYGGGLEYFDGQTIKTKNLTDVLVQLFGKESIKTIDTHGGFRKILQVIIQTGKAIKESYNVIMLPAHNGVVVLSPIMVFFKKLYPSHKIHYVVIGGWLPKILRKRILLRKCLKGFDGIYVETSTMKESIEKFGLKNVQILPNFKVLKRNKEEDKTLQKELTEPYKLCTFSRVIKAKGIEEAVNAVNKINEFFNRDVFRLDIYGSIDDSESKWFEELKGRFGNNIKYKGVVLSQQSSLVLNQYFALLFPTRFYTEGIPGTIIDAYAVGVPVISSRWESFNDVVDDGITGIGYDFNSNEGLYDVLLNVANDPNLINSLRNNCYNKYYLYTPEHALKSLVERMI